MAPACRQANGLQALIRTRFHRTGQFAVLGDPFLSRSRCCPVICQIRGPFDTFILFDDQFELRPIELSNHAGISAAQHRLDRLPTQPEKNRKKNRGTGEENVLHLG